MKKARHEWIKKEQEELSRIEYEQEVKRAKEKRKEEFRLKRSQELQDYIKDLKLQQKEAEEIRIESLERKIKQAEIKYENIQRKREHDKVLLKLSIHKKMEEASERVHKNREMQEKSWEEK